MYAKRGGVAAYHIVWINLCLRSVPGVRVLARAVDVHQKTVSSMKQADLKDKFKKVSKSAFTSTLVVSPDLLSPTT